MFLIWVLQFRDNIKKRVLCLDGGGIRGALSAGKMCPVEDPACKLLKIRPQRANNTKWLLGVLAVMEAELRNFTGRQDLVLADVFDVVGGTSTVSIPAVKKVDVPSVLHAMTTLNAVFVLTGCAYRCCHSCREECL